MTENQLNGNFKVNSDRETIELVLPDGRVYTGQRGATLAELLKALPEWNNPPIMGAVVNGELRELTSTVEMDARLSLITMQDDDGARIYRRSITFLLEAAFEQLFPDHLMTLDHSVSAGGYYCQVSKGEPLTHEDIDKLLARMRQLVDEDLPFERQVVPIDEVLAYFSAKAFTDKLRLLKYRQKEYLVLYRLGEHRDYHHGYMVPSTGYLQWFGLEVMGEGFVLRFPRRENPKKITPMPSYPKLLSTFRQYGNWLQR